MEALQLRMSEIERWFASVKAEAVGERQMRDQASKQVSKLVSKEGRKEVRK